MQQVYRPIQTRAGYVWRPALHYGLAYIVFALATRSARIEATTSPLSFASAFAIGAGPVLTWSLWSAWRRRRAQSGPYVKLTPANVMSGLATIVIVAATVMAFMFEQVSILLALLAMRLGVMLMAPVIDLAGGRSISARTITAGLICIAGIGLAGVSGTFSPLSGPVVLVLCAYLIGYGFRLALMTRHTKSKDRAIRGDWFVVEISMVTAALIIFGTGSGIASFEFRGPSWDMVAATMSGAAYAYALINGTLIYLDWRENAHSVTINRSTSLLSGVAASLIGWAAFGIDMPAAKEWVLAGFMGLALAILASADRRKGRSQRNWRLADVR